MLIDDDRVAIIGGLGKKVVSRKVQVLRVLCLDTVNILNFSSIMSGGSGEFTQQIFSNYLSDPEQAGVIGATAIRTPFAESGSPLQSNSPLEEAILLFGGAQSSYGQLQVQSGILRYDPDIEPHWYW